MSDSSNQNHGRLQGLIAEIGNHHLGDLEKAKRLISTAHAAGATLVKMQAIDPEIVSQYGSMPRSFYDQVAMTNSEYEQCVDHGRKIGVPVFFSVFGAKAARVMRKFKNNYYKISGGQFLEWGPTKLGQYNNSKTIVSLPIVKSINIAKASAVKNMQKMFVTKYLDENPPLNNIATYKTIFGESIGYSDHTKGVDFCKMAVRDYGSRLVEKHFHLGDPIEWEGIPYRDCLHAATPDEFNELAIYMRQFI